MKINKEILVLVAAYILLLPVMFILPFFSMPGYSIIRNTLSELGAQLTPNAWIMNLELVFLAFGSMIAGWVYYKGFGFQKIILVLFGISLILASFFNHAPINPDIRYNINENGWHAYFISATGLSFIILSVTTGFIPEKHPDRLPTLFTIISVIILSALMSEAEMLAGIWQRLLFIIPFGWMIYIFKSGKL
jgi:hypothetical protein